MKKDDTVYLRHILDAVVRQIEIISGAAKNISVEFQEKHSSLPWAKMTGIRKKVIHEYFNINYSIVWDTVQDDLPLLKKSVKKIL